MMGWNTCRVTVISAALALLAVSHLASAQDVGTGGGPWGILDTAAGQGTSDTVYGLATPADGDSRVLVGGFFTSCGGLVSPHVCEYSFVTKSFQPFNMTPAGMIGLPNAVLKAGYANRSYVLSTTGGSAPSGTLRWTGSSPSSGSWLFALAVITSAFLEFRGQLMVGTDSSAFGFVGFWDGGSSTFEKVYGQAGVFGVDDHVYALVQFQNMVAIGGRFKRAASNTLFASGVVLWDPDAKDFYALEDTTSPSGSEGVGGSSAAVMALAVLNGELYVGGTFTSVGGTYVAADNIARWTPAPGGAAAGGAWKVVGNGVGSQQGTNAPIRALAVVGGRVFLGGGGFTVAAGVAVRSIASHDGINMYNLVGGGVTPTVGMTAYVNALLPYGQDCVVVGGTFIDAGGYAASNVAIYNLTLELLNAAVTPSAIPPTPSTTPSPSATSSVTASPTASSSRTGSVTPSTTASPSASPTSSQTTSATGSVTASTTNSRSGSPTNSPTSSATASRSGSASVLATPSNTMSGSASITGSATASATPSVTSSVTGSVSSSVSSSAISSRTGSASPSVTSSSSTNATTSPTPSFTGSVTGSPTGSPSVSVSGGASVSRSSSVTHSPSPSLSQSLSPSPSRAATSAAPLQSAAASSAATPTLSQPPAANSGVSSGTATISATATATATATKTPFSSPSSSRTGSGGAVGPMPTATATLSGGIDAATASPSPSASISSSSTSGSSSPTPSASGATAISGIIDACTAAAAAANATSASSQRGTSPEVAGAWAQRLVVAVTAAIRVPVQLSALAEPSDANGLTALQASAASKWLCGWATAAAAFAADVAVNVGPQPLLPTLFALAGSTVVAVNGSAMCGDGWIASALIPQPQADSASNELLTLLDSTAPVAAATLPVWPSVDLALRAATIGVPDAAQPALAAALAGRIVPPSDTTQCAAAAIATSVLLEPAAQAKVAMRPVLAGPVQAWMQQAGSSGASPASLAALNATLVHVHALVDVSSTLGLACSSRPSLDVALGVLTNGVGSLSLLLPTVSVSSARRLQSGRQLQGSIAPLPPTAADLPSAAGVRLTLMRIDDALLTGAFGGGPAPPAPPFPTLSPTPVPPPPAAEDAGLPIVPIAAGAGAVAALLAAALIVWLLVRSRRKRHTAAVALQLRTDALASVARVATAERALALTAAGALTSSAAGVVDMLAASVDPSLQAPATNASSTPAGAAGALSSVPARGSTEAAVSETADAVSSALAAAARFDPGSGSGTMSFPPLHTARSFALRGLSRHIDDTSVRAAATAAVAVSAAAVSAAGAASGGSGPARNNAALARAMSVRLATSMATGGVNSSSRNVGGSGAGVGVSRRGLRVSMAAGTLSSDGSFGALAAPSIRAAARIAEVDDDLQQRFAALPQRVAARLGGRMSVSNHAAAAEQPGHHGKGGSQALLDAAIDEAVNAAEAALRIIMPAANVSNLEADADASEACGRYADLWYATAVQADADLPASVMLPLQAQLSAAADASHPARQEPQSAATQARATGSRVSVLRSAFEARAQAADAARAAAARLRTGVSMRLPRVSSAAAGGLVPLEIEMGTAGDDDGDGFIAPAFATAASAPASARSVHDSAAASSSLSARRVGPVASGRRGVVAAIDVLASNDAQRRQAMSRQLSSRGKRGSRVVELSVAAATGAAAGRIAAVNASGSGVSGTLLHRVRAGFVALEADGDDDGHGYDHEHAFSPLRRAAEAIVLTALQEHAAATARRLTGTLRKEDMTAAQLLSSAAAAAKSGSSSAAGLTGSLGLPSSVASAVAQQAEASPSDPAAAFGAALATVVHASYAAAAKQAVHAITFGSVVCCTRLPTAAQTAATRNGGAGRGGGVTVRGALSVPMWAVEIPSLAGNSRPTTVNAHAVSAALGAGSASGTTGSDLALGVDGSFSVQRPDFNPARSGGKRPVSLRSAAAAVKSLNPAGNSSSNQSDGSFVMALLLKQQKAAGTTNPLSLSKGRTGVPVLLGLGSYAKASPAASSMSSAIRESKSAAATPSSPADAQGKQHRPSSAGRMPHRRSVAVQPFTSHVHSHRAAADGALEGGWASGSRGSLDSVAARSTSATATVTASSSVSFDHHGNQCGADADDADAGADAAALLSLDQGDADASGSFGTYGGAFTPTAAAARRLRLGARPSQSIATVTASKRAAAASRASFAAYSVGGATTSRAGSYQSTSARRAMGFSQGLQSRGGSAYSTAGIELPAVSRPVSTGSASGYSPSASRSPSATSTMGGAGFGFAESRAQAASPSPARPSIALHSRRPSTALHVKRMSAAVAASMAPRAALAE